VWASREALLAGDLLTGERALQRVLRQVGSAVESSVLAQRAQGSEGEAGGCPICINRRSHGEGSCGILKV